MIRLLQSVSKVCAAVVFVATAGFSASDLNDLSVLVFTKTNGSRHDAIPTGIKCFEDLGERNGFTVDTSEDDRYFTKENLDKYGTVIFLNTYGAILGDAPKQAFSEYITSGGGWIGIHGTANTETGWSWFGTLLGNGAWSNGGTMAKYPNIRESKTHFIVKDMPDTITFDDEYYAYKANPRTAVTMLYHANEPSSPGDHPSAWCHEVGSGRAVYMTWGHTDAIYSDSLFVKFLMNSILWTSHKDVIVSVKPESMVKREPLQRLLAVKNTKDGLILSVNGSGLFSIQIFDASGRTCFNNGSVEGTTSIVCPLHSGAYVVQVTGNDGRALVRTKICR